MLSLQQYWADDSRPYRFICAAEMEKAFKAFHVGQSIAAELAQPPERTEKGNALFPQSPPDCFYLLYLTTPLGTSGAQALQPTSVWPFKFVALPEGSYCMCQGGGRWCMTGMRCPHGRA